MLKSKHCYFFNITLPWIKIWRWQSSRYLCNHGFLLCWKFQCLKFRYTEVIYKKLFLSILETHNCVKYLWTCPSSFSRMTVWAYSRPFSNAINTPHLVWISKLNCCPLWGNITFTSICRVSTVFRLLKIIIKKIPFIHFGFPESKFIVVKMWFRNSLWLKYSFEIHYG